MKTKLNCSELFIRTMEGLAQGRDIPHLAMMLAEELGRTVILTDAVNRVLGFHDPLGTGVNVGEFFPLDLRKTGDREADFFTEVDRFNEGQWETAQGVLSYIYFALKVPGKHYGHCIVLCTNQELTAEQRMIIQQVSLTLLLALREVLHKELNREWVLDEFVYDVLYNNYDSKLALYEKARHLHWNLEGPYAIIVIESPEDKLPTVRRLGPARFNSSPPVYTVINENTVVILSLTNLTSHQVKEALTEFIAKLLANLTFNYIKDVHIGVGSTATALTDLHQRFQEAKIALELGKVFGTGNPSYFNEMGFLKFIFTAPAQELQEFAQRILGHITAYDLEAETDLLNTLRTFINQQCQITPCAKALYIHENTLRNRLKKIEQLLELDLNRVDHLVNIYIALQIHNMDHFDDI